MKGKIVVMTKPGELEYQVYDVPDPDPGSIVAKILRSNVCGSELHIWRGEHPVLKRAALGHEMLGAVVKLGKGVKTDFAGAPLAVGDRIAATYFQACRRCGPCQHGDFNLCEHAYQLWTSPPEQAPHFTATFATHYYIHQNQYVYRVPDNVPDAVAAGANCALSQVYYGLEDRARLQSGETVVIQGAGGLGLYATAIAKDKGARVIIIDAVAARLEEARRFGADELIDFKTFPAAEARLKRVNELTGGGADVVLEVAGVVDAFAEGIQMVRPGGRYVGVGIVSVGKTTTFDPGWLTRRGITILPTIRYQPWYLGKALAFLSRTMDRFPYASMMDRQFRLDQVKEALDKSASREVIRASIVNTD